MSIKNILATAALALATTTGAQAAVVIYTWESGTDVEVSFSGSLDLTGASTGAGGFVLNELNFWPSVNFVTSAGTSGGIVNYSFVSTSGSAGTGGFASISGSSEGDSIRFAGAGPSVGLLATYASGDSLSGKSTFAGASFASLGLVSGDVVGTLPSGDTVTWKIGVVDPAAIPVPAGLPLAATALGLLALLRRRARA